MTTSTGTNGPLLRARRPRAACIACLTVLLFAPAARAETDTTIRTARELKALSLDELFDLEVTSVSKKPEKLSEAPAAIRVVTGEDIRRSGALSIPEALRNIPGVEVARIDSRQYAITARGFNGSVANKLLVMIDGRSVYTPLFSGVFWDAQDTLIEDIDRIEVIRGPGATVWGANAVNGVINIITKRAEDTQGLLLTGGAGNEERGFGGARYGGRLGSNAFYRVYGKFFDRDDAVLPDGSDAEDPFEMGQGGFRIDWTPSPNNLLVLQGDLYDGTVGQTNAGDLTLSGGNVLGRWTRVFTGDSDLQVQVYYDRTERDIPAVFGETLDTFDLDVRHRLSPGQRHDVVWGAGYRRTDNRVDNGAMLAFLPTHVDHDLFTAFVQDDLAIVEDRLRLTLGSKVEHNDYTGVEVQPSARLAWTPAREHLVWGAVSRAVRTPSRIDRDLFAPPEPPHLIAGGDGFDAERVYAYELGYRVQPARRLSASVSTFYNTYDDLRSVEGEAPFTIANGLRGESYGAEISSTLQATEDWRLRAGYTYFDLHLETKPGSTDTTQVGQEGDSPRHQAFLQSRLDVLRNVEFDAGVRYVDALPNQDAPDYVAIDARLGWHATRDVEIALAGQNLLDPRHAEFGAPATRREIERSVYLKVTCRF